MGGAPFDAALRRAVLRYAMLSYYMAWPGMIMLIVREFPGKLESRNLSREILSREIGRRLALWALRHHEVSWLGCQKCTRKGV